MSHEIRINRPWRSATWDMEIDDQYIGSSSSVGNLVSRAVQTLGKNFFAELVVCDENVTRCRVCRMTLPSHKMDCPLARSV